MEDAVRGAAPYIMDNAPAPGKWTIRQILCHLTDSETVAATRFRMFVAQPGSLLKAYDQEKWADTLGYANMPLEDTLRCFVAVRRNTVNMLRALPLQAWERKAVHEERGEGDLFGQVEHNAKHAETHAGQVMNIRNKAGITA